MNGNVFLKELPALQNIVSIFDEFLSNEHPSYFGSDPKHPILAVKRSKIIHDNLWGTNKFFWRELAIIDSPIFQRLRDIHQVGLSYQVYMCARHTRFEHSLGVLTIASRIFDSLFIRQRHILDNILQAVIETDKDKGMIRLKHELRLAALLHDIGHCIHSHTSEQVYGNLRILKAATNELTELAGKEKGAAETIAFCLTLTDSIRKLVERAGKKLIGDLNADDYEGEIDFVNVALMIIGRSSHPYLQFMGDIISSGFDADKIDYLMRDATCAGLPLRYDIDRYLFSLEIEEDQLTDGAGKLEILYKKSSEVKPEKKEPTGNNTYPYYEAYRLRLPEKAMNTIEQIVICKLMLYSYIYHHQKVRASEGMLRRMLEKIFQKWIDDQVNDEEILKKFLRLTDSSLYGLLKKEAEEVKDGDISYYPYRITNRLLPREIYCLNGAAATHAEGHILKNFFTDLQSRDKRPLIVASLEQEIGKELISIDPSLGETTEQALLKAGVWLDIPKPPKFEDVDELVVKKRNKESGIPLKKVFPIGEWTDAYKHYRYPIRIFSFSEYAEESKRAAENAMKKVIKIQGEDFYKAVTRSRT
ncbi:MAG: HD domain-containing protein [Smithella sp.]